MMTVEPSLSPDARGASENRCKPPPAFKPARPAGDSPLPKPETHPIRELGIWSLAIPRSGESVPSEKSVVKTLFPGIWGLVIPAQQAVSLFHFVPLGSSSFQMIPLGSRYGNQNQTTNTFTTNHV
jgi:hypothetical protein